MLQVKCLSRPLWGVRHYIMHINLNFEDKLYIFFSSTTFHVNIVTGACIHFYVCPLVSDREYYNLTLFMPSVVRIIGSKDIMWP